MSFKDMKISRKLTVGFGILVILILILGGSSFWGFSTYREIARDNVLMGRVQANLLEARLQVKNFIQTNSDASVTEFNNRFTTLNEIMANAQSSINNPTRAEKVDFIDENLDTYEETFGEVVEYFKQRQVFVDDNAVKGAKIRENITEIMRTANRDKDPAAAYYAGVLQEHLLLGRLYFYKFLDDNLDEDYERIIEELEEKSIPLLDVLDRELQNPTRRKLRQEIVDLMPTYINNVKEVYNIIKARNALIQNVLDEIGPQVATAAEDVKLDIKAEQDTLGPMVTIIIIVVAIVSIILAIFVTRLITNAIAKPINRAVEAADKISAGDLKVDLKTDAKDETGMLLSAMDTMTDNVEALLAETNRLINSTKKGQLDVRGDSSKYQGAWFDLINGVNELVDAFVGPINVTAEYVDRVSKGDIPPKITDDYQGDFNEIKNNLNNLIDVMGGLLQETNVIIKNVDQGKLDYRADSGQFIGGWGELVSGINNIIDSFVGPINVTAEYIDRVSKGDIPPKITDDYQGDFNEIKNNLNNLIDVMNGLLVETDNVIDAVKQGKLDFRANSGQFIAKWGELVAGINEIVDAFVAPVNVTAEYVDRVSKGDIPPKITDEYQGDFNEIKNNLNQLIDNLNLFVNDMNYMSKQHDLGDIDIKIDESKYTGAYNEMASGVNEMVFGHISVKKKAIGVFEEYGNGNFNANMERLPGKKVFINEAIDNVQKNLKSFGDEIKALVEFTKKGQLEKRGDASKFRGDWAEMVDGANDLIDAFVTPLNEAGEVLSIMATGDLRTKMKGNYQGDLQKLKNDINTLGESLTNLISEVSETVETTASSALEISSTAESLAAATQEQSSQADEVASAVEEMSRTVTENAMSASKTSEMAQNNGTIATEGGDVVEQTVQKMKDIAKVVKNSAGNIQKLGESSKQIGEIISVIDDIADQTNLLALNAAIEAARAGEQGRGFAVVADEVRKLAERTTDATKKIADMIKGIQKETEEAVVAMNQGTEEVNSGIDLADKAGQSLNTILTSTKDVEDMINQIAAASEEQSATSEQISKNVVSISKVTSESAHRVEDVARTAEDLAKLTEHLKELMSQFKVEGSVSYSGGSSIGNLQSNGNKHLPEAVVEEDDIF